MRLGLRGRLMLALGSVVVVAVVAVGIAAERATRVEFGRFLEVEEAARLGESGVDPRTLNEPLARALAEGGWDAVRDRLARRFAGDDSEWAVVLGPDDRVLAVSASTAGEIEYATGPEGELTLRRGSDTGVSEIFQLRLPWVPIAGPDGSEAGRLFVLPVIGGEAGRGDHPREVFLGSVSRWIVAAVAAAGLLALAVAFLATGRVLAPVEELTRAAAELAAGRLDRRVTPRSDDEIGRLARAFNSMAAALERNEALRRDMVSDTAHELRTPITNLRCQIEALGDGVIEPRPEVLESLEEEVRALQTLVDDLQQLALADAGQLSIEIEGVEPREEIERAVRLVVQSRGERPAIEVEAAGLPAAAAEPRRLQQVLANLLANAVAHTPADGTIRLLGELVEDGVRISVEDSGPGLDPEQRERVFERFYRTDASRQRATGGSGLGLAIVRQLVEAQGGRVWADEAPAGGAAFRFTLRRARPAEVGAEPVP